MSSHSNRNQRARSRWGAVNHYYDSSNHVRVLLCRYGSIWPKVLPFCILNLTLSCLLVYLMRYHNITLDISTQTHGVLSVIAAFLSVTKISMSLDRFQQLRTQFSVLYREPREFIQHMVVFSLDDAAAKATTTSNAGTGIGQSSRPKVPQPSDPNSAVDWRNEVAYLLMILLRTVVAAVRYDFSNIPAWNIPELLNSDLRKDVCFSLKVPVPSTSSSTIDPVIERENNFRVPIRIAYLLRKSMYSQHKRLYQPLDYLEESTLFNSLTTFMAAYHEVVGIVTTPIPFPMVQMSRTFIFFYIYTLPSALLTASSTPVADLVVLFIVTYGFIGLELISVELDDPFGDDVIDFDTLGSIHTVFEDIYSTIHSVDGSHGVDSLFTKLNRSNDGLEARHTDEKSWLFSDK